MTVRAISDGKCCDPQKIPGVRLEPCDHIFGHSCIVNRHIHQRIVFGNAISYGFIVDRRVVCCVDDVWGPDVEDTIST